MLFQPVHDAAPSRYIVVVAVSRVPLGGSGWAGTPERGLSLLRIERGCVDEGTSVP